MNQPFNIALAQIAPVWLNKSATSEKIISTIDEAGQSGARLIVFGEAVLPGYPFWLSFTGGAAFDDPIQKDLYAYYAKAAVNIPSGDLDGICQVARANNIAVYLGIIERAPDRGGHSLYCSLVYIDATGAIQSVHRKLQPTYEERLVWASGDGHGLRVHPLDDFKVGGLNCWENWMPMARTALYGQGENLHVAVWPGSLRNTQDITRFIACEARSYVVSVSALLSKSDISKDIPHYDLVHAHAPDVMANGGSCVIGPNGEWVLEPVVDKAGLFYAALDYDQILRERQNFDPSGHYARPDVLRLHVDNTRQQAISFEE